MRELASWHEGLPKRHSNIGKLARGLALRPKPPFTGVSGPSGPEIAKKSPPSPSFLSIFAAFPPCFSFLLPLPPLHVFFFHSPLLFPSFAPHVCVCVSKRVFLGGLEKSLKKSPKKSENTEKIPKKVRKSAFWDFFGYFLRLFSRPPQKTLFETFLRFRARRARRLL